MMSAVTLGDPVTMVVISDASHVRDADVTVGLLSSSALLRGSSTAYSHAYSLSCRSENARCLYPENAK